MRAAFELMAERGADAVSIQEITDAADVGFGSFYNHFSSKEALYEAVLTAVFDEFGSALEQLTAKVADPAEVVAICVRHTIVYAQRQPLWARFFLREGHSARALTRGLAPHLTRDIERGIEQQRFVVPDLLLAVIGVGGVVMGTIALQSASHRLRGLSTKNLDERAAANALRSLGLRESEALKIAQRPLPALERTPLLP